MTVFLMVTLPGRNDSCSANHLEGSRLEEIDIGQGHRYIKVTSFPIRKGKKELGRKCA